MTLPQNREERRFATAGHTKTAVCKPPLLAVENCAYLIGAILRKSCFAP
jgi:hypothetical protein